MPIAPLLPLLAGLAPLAARLIGNALDGKAGARAAGEVAAEITGAATRIFGTAEPAAVAQAIARDPARAAEFAQAAQVLATQLQLAALQADRENIGGARAHQAALAAGGAGWQASAPTLLSVLIVLGFFGTLMVLVARPVAVDQAQRELLALMLGALTLAFGDVRGYWLGSSAGSRAKDGALADQARQAVLALGQRPHAQAAPPAWRRHFADAAGWRLTPAGIVTEGEEAPRRTVGEPATIRRILRDHGPALRAAAAARGVPVELALAALAALPGAAPEEMVERIAADRAGTDFQPPLVAAALASGGLSRAEGNRWRLDAPAGAIERFLLFFNDACAVERGA